MKLYLSRMEQLRMKHDGKVCITFLSRDCFFTYLICVHSIRDVMKTLEIPSLVNLFETLMLSIWCMMPKLWHVILLEMPKSLRSWKSRYQYQSESTTPPPLSITQLNRIMHQQAASPSQTSHHAGDASSNLQWLNTICTHTQEEAHCLADTYGQVLPLLPPRANILPSQDERQSLHNCHGRHLWLKPKFHNSKKSFNETTISREQNCFLVLA